MWSLRRPVRWSSVRGTQSARTLWETHGGEGGTQNPLTIGESNTRLVWAHLVSGGANSGDGEASCMVMGIWSEPVEAREVSQPLTKGGSRGLANARSMREGRASPERGNLVYMPGEFSRVKPPSAANSEYGAQAVLSLPGLF